MCESTVVSEMLVEALHDLCFNRAAMGRAVYAIFVNTELFALCL